MKCHKQWLKLFQIGLSMECTRWHKNQQAYLEVIWKENKTDDVICLHFGVYGNICGHMIPSSVQYYFQCVINNIWTYLIDKNNQSRDLLLSLDRYLYPKLLRTMQKKKCPVREMSFLNDVIYFWKFKSYWEMESYELIIVMRKILYQRQ